MRLLEERRLPEGREPAGRQGLRRRIELRPGRRDPEVGEGLLRRQERRADRHLLRLPRRRLAALVALGVAAGTIGGYSLGRHSVTRAISTQAGGVHAAPECTSAVARANTSLAWAVKMGRAFVQQTQVVNQLARGQTTVAGALRADQAPTAEGAAAISSFNNALAEYLRVVDSCQLESSG